MDFSELSKYSGLACFSPDGSRLATSEQNRIIVRACDTLQTLHSFTCLDGVCCLSFSPDSTLIFGAQFKRKIVQVFSLRDPAWTCKIDEALAGLTHAQWTPDSRHIITRSEFNLRLSIWSLSRRSVVYIKQPKLMPPAPIEQNAGMGTASVATEAGGAGNVKFSESGQFMAVLTRIECKDVMNIYSVASSSSAPSVESNETGNGWNLLKQFHIDTDDCVQIDWAPDDSSIVCVDSPLTYNIVTYTPSGQKLLQYSAYEHALGIKNGAGVKWSPSANFLAAGSYDQQLRVFNNATGQLITSFVHTSQSVNQSAILKKSSNLVLYAEKPLNPGSALSKMVSQASMEDKENNPLDDTTMNFETANVSVLEGVSAPADEDVNLTKAVGALKGLVAGKKKPATGAAAGTGVKLKSSATKVASNGSLSSRGKSSTVSMSSSSSSSSQPILRKHNIGVADSDKPTISVPSKYVVEDLPLQLVSIQPSVEKADPKIGVGIIGWSVGDRYLLSRNDNTPNAVWVWDVQKLSLTAVLTQLDAVRCLAWDPRRQRFALCTSTSKLYLWSPEGCSIVDVPLAQGQSFQVRKMEWNTEGTCILLMDKNKFCCCYMRD